MVGISFMQIILMLGLSGGGGSLDLASSLSAKHYFVARNIEISADKLMQLAAETPDSGKKQMAQLFALAHLASEPDLLKKAPKASEYREVLVDISEGKLANDPAGFAAQYAKRILFALRGERPPAPAKRNWRDSVRLHPVKSDLIGLIDLAASQTAERKASDLGALFDILPAVERDAFWSAIEKVGNCQVDSLGVSLSYDAAGDKVSEFVVRITGKTNPDWLVAGLGILKEGEGRLGPKGEKIRFLSSGGAPAIAIVGANEVLIGGYAIDPNKNHQEVLDRLLVQRDNASSGPLQGPLKTEFAKVPVDASAFVVGSLPKELRNGAPFPIPLKIFAHAKSIAGGTDLQAQGMMADEMEAKAFVEKVDAGRNQLVQELNKVKGQPVPLPFNFDVLIGMLEGIQLQAKGSDAHLRILLPDDSMSLPMMFGMPLMMRARAVPPPPVPAPPPKVEEKKK
jgi:hypothetical protein